MHKRSGWANLTDLDCAIIGRLINGSAMIRIDIHNENDEQILPTNEIDPETALLKIEELNSLSNEARSVIDLILYAPLESLGLFTTPAGNFTKRSVRLGLQKIWKSKFMARTVVEELTKWTNRL